MVILSQEEEGVTIELKAEHIGNDYCVMISGGDIPHIGAVAIAQPRPSLQNEEITSASASVISVVGHKEDLLAHAVSLRLAALLNCVVCVTCGIHIDDVKPNQIHVIQKQVDSLIDALIEQQNHLNKR